MTTFSTNGWLAATCGVARPWRIATCLTLGCWLLWGPAQARFHSAPAGAAGETPSLAAALTPDGRLRPGLAGRFALDSLTGQLTVAAPLDYETQPAYALTVRVTDDGTPARSTSTLVRVNLTDVNEAPSLADQTVSLSENAALGTVVGQPLAATDPDAGQTLSYAITAGNTGGAFALGATGQLTVTNPAAVDFETNPTFILTVVVSDNGSPVRRDTATVTVNLVDSLESLTISTNELVPAGHYASLTVTGTGVATLDGPVEVDQAVLVQSGGVLADDCELLTGTASFTLEAGATLWICAAGGISLGGPSGAVQVTGPRSYAADARYVYAGSVPQLTGNGLPNPVRELAVRNVRGVILSQAGGVTEVLRLQLGLLVTNEQVFTLYSTAQRTAYAVHEGGNTLGNITVQRYVGGPAGAGYRHLSSPVQGTIVADLATAGFTPRVNAAYNSLPYVAPSAANFPTVLGYDETRGGTSYAGFTTGYYSPTSLGSVLTPGRGWSAYMRGGVTPDFVGELQRGPVAQVLTVTGTNTSPNTQKTGWHLLGNPYPQPIDWNIADIPAGMSSSISVFRTTGGNGGQYLTWANGLGTLPDGIVPLGQAFFARATAPVTFRFTGELRVEANPATVARAAADARPVVSLTLRDAAGAGDETFVYVQAGATLGEDARFDGLKPGLNEGVATLATRIGEAAAAVNGLPAEVLTEPTVVELVAEVPAAGDYTLAVSALKNWASTTVALEDRLTGTRYDLAQQPTVRFRAERPGSLGQRFALVLNGQRVLGAGVDLAASALGLWPNPARGVVRVTGASGPLTLLDATGRVVRTAPAGTAVLELAGLPAGVYVVRSGAQVQRLVVE